ncbi:hypothetical protein FUAX_47870 (plasmid) [Fulvitalea axinellae]|uniref:Uncharacterized protein n=1 Tax=Fulvitalea axinellae TaxID=1182444 RepID=A0AAU9DMD6_9BACT|nr:hypothetical protein FUAX_47870 [Fulvitalea axinellae]
MNYLRLNAFSGFIDTTISLTLILPIKFNKIGYIKK